MRKVLRASVLLLVLCCPILAGEIHNPPVTQPTPTPPSAAEKQSMDGIIECPLTQIAVSLLGNVLALF